MPLTNVPDSLPIDSTAIDSLCHLPMMTMPEHGMARPLTGSPLHDTGSMVLMLAAVILVALCYRKGYKYVSNLWHNMVSTRTRENLFDDHTVNETQILTALVLNTCVMEGLLLFHGFMVWYAPLRPMLTGNVLQGVLVMTAAAVVYYLVQLAAYHLLGYVFSDSVGKRLLVDGFKASQSLLGLLLFPVTGFLLVWPGHATLWLIVAIILCFLVRIVFLIKGFRIFYTGLDAYVHFILYLCAAEIVPVVILLSGVIGFCQFLTH